MAVKGGAVCTVPDCGRAVKARGLCGRCLQRGYKTGAVETVTVEARWMDEPGREPGCTCLTVRRDGSHAWLCLAGLGPVPVVDDLGAGPGAVEQLVEAPLALVLVAPRISECSVEQWDRWVNDGVGVPA